MRFKYSGERELLRCGGGGGSIEVAAIECTPGTLIQGADHYVSKLYQIYAEYRIIGLFSECLSIVLNHQNYRVVQGSCVSSNASNTNFYVLQVR